MNLKARRILVLILLFLFIIPNISFANTDYKTNIQNYEEMKLVFKWAESFLNHITNIKRNIITIDKPGVYELGNCKGTIIINAGNVTLKNTKLTGNIIVAESKSNEELKLINVEVYGYLSIYRNNAKLSLDGKFKNVLVSSRNLNLYFNNGSIDYLTVNKNTQGATLILNNGTEVKYLLLEAGIKVNGKGLIRKATVNSNGVSFEQAPLKLEKANGISVQLGALNKISFGNRDSNDSNNDAEIVSEIKKDLKLVINGAVGRKASPKIILPISDNKNYQSSITWVSSNTDFIQIDGNEALIFRRGVNDGHSGEHDDGGCENDDHDSASVKMLSLMAGESEDCSDNENTPEECGGSGGSVNFATLTATIKKGSAVELKTFNVSIPWGWGKAISFVESSSGSENEHEHEHEISTPLAKVIPEQVIYINQYPLYISSEDLAQYGEKITDFNLISVSTTASAITPSGIAAVNIIDKSLLKIEPKSEGMLAIVASVENSLGKTDVSFKVLVKSADIVDDSTAVNNANAKLKLKLISHGKDTKQTNKIILPDTDYLGYGTDITWKSDNNEFLDIEQDIGIINRRGLKSEGGCEDHSVEGVLSVLHAESNEEEDCDGNGGESHEEGEGGCSEDEGHEDDSCGGEQDEGGNDKGKSTKVTLTATIKRGDAEITKNIYIKIPWGWGRAITISY